MKFLWMHLILMNSASYVDKDGETRVDGDLNTKEIALYRQNTTTRWSDYRKIDDT